MTSKNLIARIIPKPIRSGVIPITENLASRAEKPLPDAIAICLVANITTSKAPALRLNAAVNPMAAITVTLVTVLTVTVVIML
jgi:hypothetical protein